MKLVEHDQRASDGSRVDIVQPIRKAVRTVEQAAQHLIVGRDDDDAALEKWLVGLLSGLESHERAQPFVNGFACHVENSLRKSPQWQGVNKFSRTPTPLRKDKRR